MNASPVTTLAEDLVLIDLDQPRPGYRKFITSWLHTPGDLRVVVDCGPASTIPALVQALRRSGVERLDWVLLTHIHLDHGGGAGQLLEAFPEARLVCFPPAAKHLIDPTRLWEGSVAVLGDNALLFGEPAPVAPERIFGPEAAASLGYETIHTPGHAPHHQSYRFGDLMFVGEAAGMTCPGPADLYMRPATPPSFHRDVAEDSLDRLLTLEPFPRRLAMAHYGLHEVGPEFLRTARAQLGLWVEQLDDLSAPGARVWSEDLQARAMTRLQAVDPLFAPFGDLDDDLRSREEAFFRNTLEGMLGWLARQDSA